ncbi:hypothetical protein BJX96DRAFT_155053 [Aspergillus floccosus]
MRSDCSSLKTLAVSQFSFAIIELVSLDSKICAAEIIAFYNARPRTIASLKGIIVDIHRESPAPYLIEEMEGYGWKLREVKQ